jgi:hypothetical protein
MDTGLQVMQAANFSWRKSFKSSTLTTERDITTYVKKMSDGSWNVAGVRGVNFRPVSIPCIVLRRCMQALQQENHSKQT